MTSVSSYLHIVSSRIRLCCSPAPPVLITPPGSLLAFTIYHSPALSFHMEGNQGPGRRRTLLSSSAWNWNPSLDPWMPFPLQQAYSLPPTSFSQFSLSAHLPGCHVQVWMLTSWGGNPGTQMMLTPGRRVWLYTFLTCRTRFLRLKREHLVIPPGDARPAHIDERGILSR